MVGKIQCKEKEPETFKLCTCHWLLPNVKLVSSVWDRIIISQWSLPPNFKNGVGATADLRQKNTNHNLSHSSTTCYMTLLLAAFSRGDNTLGSISLSVHLASRPRMLSWIVHYD